MKRILSTLLAFVMIFALCAVAFAAVDTGKKSGSSIKTVLGFSDNASRTNHPTFPDGGAAYFRSPAEDVENADCYLVYGGSLKAKYGSKFAFAFELKLNKIDGDTSTNPIFMIQIKDGNGEWKANHRFFTITGDGAGAYVLADGGNADAAKIALATDTWYQFVIHFDLDADTATVVGGKYASNGKGYTTLYTAKLNAKGDIPQMGIGQCDQRTGWKYDYIVDSLRFFSTSTDFSDGVIGQPYKAGIFETKTVLNDKTTPSSYKVSAPNKVMHFRQDGSKTADCALWISEPTFDDYTKLSTGAHLTNSYGKKFTIEADYCVLTQGTAPFGFETKSKSGWFNKALPAYAGWHHVTYTADYDAGNFKVEVDGATIAEKTGDTGTIDYDSFRLGCMTTIDNAACEYLVDNIRITPAEGEAVVIDFEDAEIGATAVGAAYAKTAHNDAEKGLGVFVDAVPETYTGGRVKIYSAGGEANKKIDGIVEVRAPQGGGLFAAFGDRFDIEFDLQVVTNNPMDAIGIEWQNPAKAWVVPKIPVADNGVHRIRFTADKTKGYWYLFVDGVQKNSNVLGEGSHDYSSLRVGSNNMKPSEIGEDSATPAFEYYIDNVLVTKADGTTLDESFNAGNAAFDKNGMYKFIYGKLVNGTVSMEECEEVVPAAPDAPIVLSAVDTTDGDGAKSDAVFYVSRNENMRPLFGDSWKVSFRYIAPNTGTTGRLGIEAKADFENWIVPKLPAADEWTDAEFICDGVNGKWALFAAGKKVEEGKIDTENFDDRSFKIGCCDEKADNTFDFAIDDVFATPILCEKIIEYSGCSLTLDGDILLNFYMNIDQEIAENSQVNFLVGGRAVEGVKAHYSEENKMYCFSCPVNALEIATDIEATFVYGDIVLKKTASVKAYLDKQAETATEPELVDLVKKIADYGFYMQKYLQSVHPNIVLGEGGYAITERISDSALNVGDALTALGDGTVTFGEGAEAILHGRTVVFDHAFALNYYVYADEAPEASCSGKTTSVSAYKDNIYRVTVENIRPDELDAEYTVTINGKTFTSSALDYCGAVCKKHADDADDTVKNAMAAVYEYYKASKAYGEKH